MRLLSCSDLHTCHRRTPTAHILRNMSRFFYTDVDLNNVDLILISGDVFDRFVDNDNPDFLLTLEWFKQFFVKCKEHNVIVRFTEGTTLHDWGQPRHIMFSVEEGTNVKYFDEITIETIEELNNLTIMYVPDNMSDKTPDEIWERALQVLTAAQLDKVDLIAFHGGFYWQLPEKARKHAHMEDRWKTIVKYGIFSGHIHIPGSWEDIIYSNGSFDRIRHGEEHPKGAWIVDIDQQKEIKSTRFWVNEFAMPYRSIRVGIDDLPESIVLSVKQLLQSQKFPVGSQFRIQGGHKSVVKPIISSLVKEYPDYGFAEDSEDDEVLVEETLFQTSDYKGVAVTQENVFGHIENEAMAKLAGTDITRDEAFDVLKEFL